MSNEYSAYTSESSRKEILDWTSFLVGRRRITTDGFLVGRHDIEIRSLLCGIHKFYNTVYNSTTGGELATSNNRTLVRMKTRLHNISVSVLEQAISRGLELDFKMLQYSSPYQFHWSSLIPCSSPVIVLLVFLSVSVRFLVRLLRVAQLQPLPRPTRTISE